MSRQLKDSFHISAVSHVMPVVTIEYKILL